MAGGMVGAIEREGTEDILDNVGGGRGKGNLVVIVVALGSMQLMMASCKKEVAVEGTDWGYGGNCRLRQTFFV